MRKVERYESMAITMLYEGGPFVPGDNPANSGIRRVLDGLVKKKYVEVESTDDGPRYSLTPMGVIYATV